MTHFCVIIQVCLIKKLNIIALLFFSKFFLMTFPQGLLPLISKPIFILLFFSSKSLFIIIYAFIYIQYIVLYIQTKTLANSQCLIMHIFYIFYIYLECSAVICRNRNSRSRIAKNFYMLKSCCPIPNMSDKLTSDYCGLTVLRKFCYFNHNQYCG